MSVRYSLIAILLSVLMFACGNNAKSDMGTEVSDTVVKKPMTKDGIVRLSKIEVFPEYLQEYLKYAVEVGETSLLTEPGVLTMYAMQEKSDSCKITILEIYASKEAYQKHIQSEHFQKYKQGTLHMVKSLELCDQTPLNEHSILTNTIE